MTILLLIIQIVFGILFLLIILPMFGVYKSNNQKHTPVNQAVSVLVYAQNQRKELEQLLPQLLEQVGITYEVIVIDHTSYDETIDVLKHFDEKYPHFSYVDVADNKKFWNNKRYALTLGIKKAKYNQLVFIDASCQLPSAEWLSKAQVALPTSKEIGLGISKPLATSRFHRYLFLKTQWLNHSIGRATTPYTLNENNIRYTQHIFFQNNGFINHMNSHDFSQELFVKEVAKKSNTLSFYGNPIHLQLPKDAKQWRKFRKQQRNLLAKQRGGVRFYHLSFLLTKIGFTIATAWALYDSIYTENYPFAAISLGVFLVLFGTYIGAIYKNLRFFSEESSKWYIPFYELLTFFNRI